MMGEYRPDGTFRPLAGTPPILFPGSFNPLHHGHLILAALAGERLGGTVVFELSIANVDKPDLPDEEVRRRLEQFRGRAAVFVTRTPTFVEKAELFPGTTFVLGADTAARVVQPRYYGDETDMARALDAIRDRGCRFFVGGRLDRDGRFVDVAGVAIPDRYRDMFAGLGETEFRVDVSSTELRRQGSG
jgi:hypothetical protein